MARKPVDLKRWLEWIDTGRSLAALLFIPVISLMGIGLTLILWLSFGRHGDVLVILAVVKWLGITLVGTLVLIGLGTLWLQRRDLPNLSIQTPWGSATLSGDDDEGAPSVRAAPVPGMKDDGRVGGAEGDVAR